MKTPPEGSPALAYSYQRFSSAEQRHGDSLKRQTKLREAWLKKHPEVRLDASLRLIDEGVSAFRGDHRANKKHALASFLDLVQRGRVPAGSYLIIENLDRLSREHPLSVMAFVEQLIQAGLRVVQLEPEVIFTADMDEGALCMLLLGSVRGHGESKRKSKMCDSAWKAKKAMARSDKLPHGRMCPAWVELSDGRYRLKEDAARTIRQIYQWSVAGYGLNRILQFLERDRVPPLGRNGTWVRSYLRRLLTAREVIGCYQPCNGRGHKVADGEEIANYYPPAIEEGLFYKAQQAAGQRRIRSGRPSEPGVSNPFSGLLWSALDKGKIHVASTSAGRKQLVNAESIEQRAVRRTFPLVPFKKMLLAKLRELSASELFRDPSAGKITELQGRLADLEKRLAVALAKFEADPESPTWADRVSRYDREKRSLVKELAQTRAAALHPASATWAEAVALMEREEPERLRAALLATIEGVWCVFICRGVTQLAAVQVWFKEGTHRDYLIVHRRPIAGAAAPKEAFTDARSFASVHQRGDLDLRKPDHAKKLERVLSNVKMDDL